MAAISPPHSFHIASNAVQSVSTSPGMLSGYFLDNNQNTVTTFYQFFFKPSTAVTLGTTVPDMVIPIPSGLAANLEFNIFCQALSFAVTTTYNGSTAPGSPVDCTVFYG